ncbi:hypothetical protein P7584_15420, partial [Staphylococcus aureus]|nr:hypothetical protein [Staphylococcus aureus]
VEEKEDIIYSLKNNEVERQPFFSFLGDSVLAAGKLVLIIIAFADSEAFRTHEKVLLHISNKPSDAYIIEKKRDTLTVIITGLFL